MDRYQKFISEKAKYKRELMGTMFFPRTPVLFLDLAKTKNAKEFKDLIQGLDALPLAVVVITPKGKPIVENTKNVRFFDNHRKSAAEKAADFAVVMHAETASVRKNGCVPIAKLDGDSTIDYNPLKEKGNGFYFKNPTKWEIFAAVVRALETYQFPYDWENLVGEILE